MNIGVIGTTVQQTTHQGHSAQGLQPNATPVSQTESLTRINASQNTSSTENKPNSNQDNASRNPEQVGIKEDTYFKNTKEYKQQEDSKDEPKEKHQDGGKETEQKTADNPQGLDEQQIQEVKELQKRDREVRAHESAHMAAAGQHAKGGIHFDMKQGPDGKSYAVGGHVSIDTSPVPNNPEATIRKARQIQAAAMAPAEPSSQDRSVAMEAGRMANEAQSDLYKVRQEEISEQQNNGVNTSAAEEKTVSGQEEQATKKNAAASAYETVAGLDSFTSKASSQKEAFHQVV